MNASIGFPTTVRRPHSRLTRRAVRAIERSGWLTGSPDLSVVPRVMGDVRIRIDFSDGRTITPAEARGLAIDLVLAADRAESYTE